MTYSVNETHDPALTSWVESANAPASDFPVQNLPYGVFARRRKRSSPRVGVAIGDQILDLAACLRAGLLDDEAADVAIRVSRARTLNGLMAESPAQLSALRRQLSARLTEGGARSDEARAKRASLLVPMRDADLHLPADVGDYTDFYASIHHATNVGKLLRPENPLLPNYKYVPIGYHGRASSLVPSGTPVRRPVGQIKSGDSAAPTRAPTRLLDYEAEVGLFVGRGNALGDTIPIDRAEDHLFGLCLVNDWSARDVQAWEYQPLGPFLAKNFATTVSPWVVTMEALAPFRAPALARPAGDPEPLPYLHATADQERGGIAVTIEVLLATGRMREARMRPVALTHASLVDLYWTPAQLLTHHASTGCNMRPGDLLATGTISGARKDSRSCLLELTRRGAEPITLPSHETRRFLEDGDEVVLQASCEAPGARRIGFGECRGVVLPAGPQ
jgi:fumarylacetoacetase